MGRMKQRNVDLDIEELILRGVPSAQRYHIAAAIERELTRLLSKQGLPQSLERGGSIPAIDIGPIHIEVGTKADAIGTQIAQSVYGKLWENQRPE